eukprot:3902107-Prymnesium_polylepis.2
MIARRCIPSETTAPAKSRARRAWKSLTWRGNCQSKSSLASQRTYGPGFGSSTFSVGSRCTVMCAFACLTRASSFLP